MPLRFQEEYGTLCKAWVGEIGIEQISVSQIHQCPANPCLAGKCTFSKPLNKHLKSTGSFLLTILKLLVLLFSDGHLNMKFKVFSVFLISKLT